MLRLLPLCPMPCAAGDTNVCQLSETGWGLERRGLLVPMDLDDFWTSLCGKARGDAWKQILWDIRPKFMASTLSLCVKPKTLQEDQFQNLHLLKFLCWWSFVGSYSSVVLHQADSFNSRMVRRTGTQGSDFLFPDTFERLAHCSLASDLHRFWIKAIGDKCRCFKDFSYQSALFSRASSWQWPACQWPWSSRF